MNRDEKYGELLRLRQLKLRGEDLLSGALCGRERTPESVTKTWLLAAEACSDGCLRPSLLYADTYESYWIAVASYLKAYWPPKKIEALRAATPWVTGGVLQEIAELEEADKLIGAKS
jgi:hypothetical protein